MWCTSGCAPVAIDERQTGVSDGKVETPRRYVPCCGEERERGRWPVVDRVLEDRRREAVDDDEDQLLALGQLSHRAEAAQAGVALAVATGARRAPGREQRRRPRGSRRR